LIYSTLESELRIVSRAVNQSASSIIITDISGSIGYINPAVIDKTGYSEEELIGQKPSILSSGKTPKDKYVELWKTLAAGNTWRGEFHNRKKNGDLYWEIASVAPVKQKNGKVSHYVAIKEDITALKAAEQRILHMANHDVLTGLPTRRFSMDRIESGLKIARRNKTKLAVLYIDIDGFKAVNDNFGHDIGDQVLKIIAQRFCDCIREVDTVARVGGDEFWVILTDIEDKHSAITVAEKLIKEVSHPYHLNVGAIDIGASIGIALYPDHALNAIELVNLADQAMYEIKRQGKNSYAIA
jgi:diguanylate cyclase (GGDEF)-like protein/PAS domain S-box-containing protein